MSPLLASARAVFREKDFVVLLGCNVLLGLATSFVVPFLSIFGTREVRMSPMQFGAFMTVTSLMGIGVATYLSQKSDVSLSRRTLLMLGGLSGAVGYAGYAYVRDFWALLLIGSTILAFSGVSFGQVFAHARDLLTARGIERSTFPLYMNVFRLAFALSWTVGPAAAAITMAHFSFRGTFLVASVLHLLFALAVAIGIPKGSSATPQVGGTAPVAWQKALLEPTLLAHFIAFTVFFVCSTMAMMNLPLLILNTLQGTEAQVGWAFSVAPVFELPFMFYLGVLATRVPHGTLIRGALLVASVYYIGLSLVGAPAHVYPLQILGAAIVAVMSGVAITFFQNFLPDQPGTATNVYVNAQRLGSTLGYLLFGSLMQSTGHRTIFAACSVGALFSYVLLRLSRSRLETGALLRAS